VEQVAPLHLTAHFACASPEALETAPEPSIATNREQQRATARRLHARSMVAVLPMRSLLTTPGNGTAQLHLHEGQRPR